MRLPVALVVLLFTAITICTGHVDPACEEDSGENVEKLHKLSSEELNRLQQSAVAGDPEAQLAWGRTFGFGIGKPQNAKTAREWYTKAAEAGNCPAQQILADWNFIGREGADPAEAYKWNLKLAERGVWSSQINVGSALMMGRGVAKDAKKGFEWLLKAADENNSANGQLAVAGAYMTGQGTERDLDRAESYARRALENGVSVAQRLLDSIQMLRSGVPVAPKFAAELKEAETGDAVAQYSVGQSYKTGRNVPQDFAQAMKWLEKSAAQGFPLATATLGEMYEEGMGVTQDLAKACDLNRTAAEKGVRRAQTRLASLYYKGNGTEVDPVNACMWYTIAARRGDKEAPSRRDQVCSELRPAHRDLANNS